MSPSASVTGQTAVIELPALDGRVPLGYLAALGVLRLLSDDTDPGVWLSWAPTTVTARLHTAAAHDPDDVATMLRSILDREPGRRVPGMPFDFPPSQAAPDPLRCSPERLAQLVAEWELETDPAVVSEWVRALVTDLASDRGRVDITPLAAPSGKQSFGTMFSKTTQAARGRASSLDEALLSWRRVDGYTGEYLDHQALFDAADSPTGESSERGVPGATWLALMALPLLPVIGDVAGRRRGTGWQATTDGTIMRWPLWQQPLDVHAVRCLIDNPALRLNRDGDLHAQQRRRLDRLGVFALATAARVTVPGRNFDGVLAPRHCLAITDSLPTSF